MSKEKNYDYTSASRQQKRTEKIKSAGLVQRKVAGHPEDFEKIHEYAKKLYKNRGISLD